MDARRAADAPHEERPRAAVWRHIRRIAAGAFGLLWCWVVLRVAVHPAQTGLVEQGFAVSGWTLGLLPVHATPWRGARPRRGGTGRAPARDGTGRGYAEDGTGRGYAGSLPPPRRPGAYTPVGATAISAGGAGPRNRQPNRGS